MSVLPPDRPVPVEQLETALAEIKRPSRWPLLALAIALVLLCAALLKLTAVAIENRTQNDVNQEAVRVSCTLLVNAIVQSGAGSQRGPAAPPSAQQQLTALYVSTIVGQMNRSQRRRFEALSQRVAQAGAGALVDVPDCAAVAAHPERVSLAPRPAARANP